jgi:hypothetical protein
VYDILTIPEQDCMCCGKRMTAATNYQRAAQIKPGDLNVSKCCGLLSRYGPELQLLPMTKKDEAALPADVLEQIDAMRTLSSLLGGIARPPGH